MRRMWIAVLAIALTTTMVALAQKTPDNAALKQAEDNAAAARAAADKARAAAEKAALDPKQLAADINKALEEILTKALQNSPDVQVAEARMKEAEALLRQARLQVTQKTVELKQTIDQKQQALLSLENQYQLLLKARAQGLPEGAAISASTTGLLSGGMAGEQDVVIAANVSNRNARRMTASRRGRGRRSLMTHRITTRRVRMAARSAGDPPASRDPGRQLERRTRQRVTAGIARDGGAIRGSRCGRAARPVLSTTRAAPWSAGRLSRRDRRRSWPRSDCPMLSHPRWNRAGIQSASSGTCHRARGVRGARRLHVPVCTGVVLLQQRSAGMRQLPRHA